MIAYFIPFVVSIILLIFFRKKIVWWEYIALISISVLVTYISRWIAIEFLEDDIEYLGGYITKITHYDDWDEWITKTCTRRVPDGEDEDGNTKYRTETYDCSYREYHPERWKYTDNYGHEEYFFDGESEFNRALEELGRPRMQFRDMHRDYYTKDGDAQDYFWDKTVQHIRPLTWTHTYKNKINSSYSLFNFEDIKDEQADSLGLFRYPKVIDNDQAIVLGYNLPKAVNKNYKYINAMYGPTKQFRLYVLVFKDKPIEISEKQKSYWKGGNKNEFIVCLGYNTKTKTVTWCNPFSWCDKPSLEVATKNYFRSHPCTGITYYPEFLKKNINLWKRKSFADFDYIRNYPTHTQNIVIVCIIFILNIILAIFFLENEYENKEIELKDNEVYYIKYTTKDNYVIELVTRIPETAVIRCNIKLAKHLIKEYINNSIIPALDVIEKSYRNTFTWKQC